VAVVAGLVLLGVPPDIVRCSRLPCGQVVEPSESVFYIMIEESRIGGRMPEHHELVGTLGRLCRVQADLEQHDGLAAFVIGQTFLIGADMACEAIFIRLGMTHLAGEFLAVQAMGFIGRVSRLHLRMALEAGGVSGNIKP